MSKKLILLSAVLFLLSGCDAYNQTQERGRQEEAAEQKAKFDQYVASSGAAVRAQIASIDREVTVCIARANATVPHAADHDIQTLQDRARYIKWAKVSDACHVEKGGTVRPRNYPSMDNMKKCDRESRSEMPSATVTQRNTYIDDCLEAAGFDPGR